MTWLPRKDQIRRVQLECCNGENSMTEQHHYPGVAVKSIMKKFRDVELRQFEETSGAFYEDMISAPEYQEAMIALARADQQFMMLPSNIRTDMNNDPAVFLDFVSKPENRERLEEYGLIHRQDPNPLEADALTAAQQTEPPVERPPEPQSQES